jgi:hypothetical protein
VGRAAESRLFGPERELVLSVHITASTKIVGAGAGKTIIQNDGSWNVFTISDGADVAISKLTITGGGEALAKRVGAGGGVRVFSDTGLTMEDVEVSGNNITGFGGGIYNAGQTTLRRVHVTGNRSGPNGGGNGGFEGNGGGIHNSGDLAVVDSTIDHNDGLRGSGINNDGELFVVNSTISGNTARTSGGGVRNAGGLVQIKSSTITDNLADSTVDRKQQGQAVDRAVWGAQNGGGIVNVLNGTMEIGGTIVAGNGSFVASTMVSSDDCYSPDTAAIPGPVTSARNNLIGAVTPSCHLLDVVEGNTLRFDRIGSKEAPRNAGLSPLALNSPGKTPTHALQFGSEAIDAASNAFPDDWFACESTDQRGAKRPVAKLSKTKVCDIGAYEVQ